MLSVKNNGFGIDKSKIERIFKMYKPLDPQTEGQGLGLLINKMINASGGKIEVESTSGEGTEFRLYIKR